MFCSECGTKSEAGAVFCENCGHKLENLAVVANVTTPVAPKPGKSFITKIKEMSTKNKIISAVAIVIVVALVVLYSILKNMTSPKTIAEKFFNATVSNDVDAIYEFLDIEGSEFTTKDMFKKVNEDEEKIKILNYTVGNPIASTDGLSTSVTITYVLDGENDSDSVTIKLVKDKNKKWLFFDNWKVTYSGMDTVKDYEIEVLKDSVVTIEGTKVDKKYIDEDKSSKTTDVYVMPEMFGTYYDAKITLPVGIEYEDQMYVTDYYSYTYKSYFSSLPEGVEEDIEKAIKDSVQIIYNGIVDGKSFDDIKASFEYEGSSLDDLEDEYEEIVSDIGDAYKLDSVDFTDVKFSSASINSDGLLEVYAKIKYDYSLTYESFDEVKTHTDSDYDYSYLTFAYIDGSYKLVDASYLIDYFSMY